MSHQLVRYKKGKLHFELMVETGAVAKWRKAETKPAIGNVIVSDVIFKNQSRGEKANEADLMTAFETDDNTACILAILEKGEVQMTTAERREKQEEKHREVLAHLHKYYIDPRTKTPHPVARFEAALAEIKYKVDVVQPVDRQVTEIMKKLPSVLPVKKSEIAATLVIPHAFMGAADNVVHQYVKVEKESWTGTGCEMKVLLVAGDFDPLMAALQNITKGDFTFEVEGGMGSAAPAEEPAAKAKGKGKKGKKGRR